jgi:hypothetical protein
MSTTDDVDKQIAHEVFMGNYPGINPLNPLIRGTLIKTVYLIWWQSDNQFAFR